MIGFHTQCKERLSGKKKSKTRSPTAVCAALVLVTLSFSVLMGCFVPKEMRNCRELFCSVLVRTSLPPSVCVLGTGEGSNTRTMTTRHTDATAAGAVSHTELVRGLPGISAGEIPAAFL